MAVKDHRDNGVFSQATPGPSFSEIVKIQDKLRSTADENDKMKKIIDKIRQIFSNFGSTNDNPYSNDSIVMEVGILLNNLNNNKQINQINN